MRFEYERREVVRGGQMQAPDGTWMPTSSALNEWGDEGWELVGFRAAGPQASAEEVYVFMRPVE